MPKKKDKFLGDFSHVINIRQINGVWEVDLDTFPGTPHMGRDSDLLVAMGKFLAKSFDMLPGLSMDTHSAELLNDWCDAKTRIPSQARYQPTQTQD
jgi:hypothetical protein